jgi:hypothetical protein
MRTYKNKTNLTQVLAGIGEVEPNGTITTDQVIENSDFEEANVSVQTEQPAQQPAAVESSVEPGTPVGGTN